MDRPKWTDVAIVILTGGIVFLGVMQWDEMHEGGKDTHDLAVQAKSQADAAGKQADAAKSMADRTKDLADRMKDQADRTKVIADQAIIQAGANKRLAQNAVDTLRNTQTAFRFEQRAWVGVQDAVSVDFAETVPWKVIVVFFNSGRTPASKVQSSVMYITSPVPISGPSPEQIQRLQFRDAQSIAPQSSYRQAIGNAVAAEPFTPFQRQGTQTVVSKYQPIKDGKLLLYYYGILKYEDNSGDQRHTQFCIFLANPTTKEVGFCDAFNDLN